MTAEACIIAAQDQRIAELRVVIADLQERNDRQASTIELQQHVIDGLRSEIAVITNMRL
jgi:hypothetical protein